MSYIKILNKMTWSFSRLHTWEVCPYSFYLKYIEEREGEQNFYAANGKLMHEVFEKLLNKEISLDECTEYYAENFDYIDEYVKDSIRENTFEKCINYLCDTQELNSDYEVLGIEQKLDFKIGKYNFVGYADLILRDIKNNEVILVDHKQASHFLKKDGTPLKNQLDNYNAYKHQMYIYCKGIKDCLGIEVNKLCWHHFKDDGQLTVIPFNQEEYDETIEWTVNTIEKIKKDKSFEANKQFMMCYQLCDYRNDCEYKEEVEDEE